MSFRHIYDKTDFEEVIETSNVKVSSNGIGMLRILLKNQGNTEIVISGAEAYEIKKALKFIYGDK